MRRTVFFVVAAVTILIAGLIVKTQSSNAVIDGDAKAQAYQVITFGNLTAADTLEAIRSRQLHKEITYQIKVESTRHVAAMTSADTVFYQMLGSIDDSSYVNISSVGATTAITTAGVYTATYDYVGSRPYITLGFVFQAADSVCVKTKAYLSLGEGR